MNITTYITQLPSVGRPFMEPLRRLFLNRSIPTNYEIQAVIPNTSSEMLEYLTIRKSKLTVIILLCILELAGSIFQLVQSETQNSKAIVATVMAFNLVVISLLTVTRVKWYSEKTFSIGCLTFVFDALKLLMLFIPYTYIISKDSFYQDVTFVFTVVMPWYVPYFTIMLLFKSNTYYLSKFSGNLATAWKILSVIYIPICLFVYGIVINLFSLYAEYNNTIPKSAITIVYILWMLGILEMFAIYHEKKRVAYILSVIWIVILLVSLYQIDEGLYQQLLQFSVTTAISGMKLNTMCKDIICHIFNIRPNDKKQSIMLTEIYSELDNVA